MGVLPCARNGCSNIMCDRYSPKYGYICDECFEELKRFRHDIHIDPIQAFMDSGKTSIKSIPTWHTILDEEFLT